MKRGSRVYDDISRNYSSCKKASGSEIFVGKKSRKVKPDKKSSLSKLLTCFSSQTLFSSFQI